MNVTSRLRHPRAVLVTSVIALVVLAAVLLLRSGSSGHRHPSVPTVRAGAVAIKNFSFSPAKLTVTAGTKVTFTNGDSTEHTATADAGGGFDTGTLAQGRSKVVVFSKSGTYTYHCAFHAFMTGSITVS